MTPSVEPPPDLNPLTFKPIQGQMSALVVCFQGAGVREGANVSDASVRLRDCSRLFSRIPGERLLDASFLATAGARRLRLTSVASVLRVVTPYVSPVKALKARSRRTT